MKWLRNLIRKIVMEQLNIMLPLEYLTNIPINKKDRLYVLVLSSEVDMDAVSKALEPYSGKLNLLVVQANQASLMELISSE